MIDPVSALAMASAAFNGIKKAVELGKEVEEVYGALSQWAGHVSDLQEYISGENKKPGIFKKIEFGKSETAEAFDEFIAKKKLQEMEAEIKHMFLYGDLCHLGIDGYRELIQMRRDIKEKREKMIYEQMRRRKEFLCLIRDVAIGVLITVPALALVGWVINLIVTHAK